MCASLLPPANEVCEGYVFAGVRLSTGGPAALFLSGGGSVWGSLPRGVSVSDVRPSQDHRILRVQKVQINLADLIKLIKQDHFMVMLH